MTKATKDLLKKKIEELTLDDFSVLEKRLGTSQRPFPMWGAQRVEHDNGSDIEAVLSFIANDSRSMAVYSERPLDEVLALAYCDMPVPSMLPLFKDGLERRGDPLQRQKDLLQGRQVQSENYNRTQMMIGDPGHGKSFLGALQGRLRSKGSVEIFDCGGKNMNDLLFEMVLDFGAADALPRAIDKRLQAGTLEPLSVALLQTLTVATVEDGGIKSIDWNALKSGATPEAVEKAYDVLTKVSKIEGLDNAGGNALGMNSQYGPLIRAFIENREIVLDEYNKSREGSDNALQTVLQFLIGEIRETTVDNPLKNKDNTSGPSSFTFKREDMGAGFFVTFTGNKNEDGVTTRSLNRSVYDRLKPDTLPDPSVIDWQHRICQMMVGVPVSTLYSTFEAQADADPDAFGDWLLALRRKKAEIEGAPVPELQQTLLTNWKNVVSASESLAKLYDRWAKMTDAEKLQENGFGELVDEVDEEYAKKEGMSFRRIKQHLEEAIPLRARMERADAEASLNLKNFFKPQATEEPVEENAALNFGTRLVEYIERMAFEKAGSVDKTKLYKKLQQSMEEFGLRDISLQEGARSGVKSVEESLNISAFTDRDINKQAAMAHKVFCDYLRQKDPDITASNDEIVSVRRFVEALENVAAKESSDTLFLPNRDLESLYAGKALTEAVVYDAALCVVDDRKVEVSAADLVRHGDLMASFGLPSVGAKNLKKIWEQNMRPLLSGAQGEDAAPPATANDNNVEEHGDGLTIAENRSRYGIGMTSVQVLADEEDLRPIVVHILHNNQRDKTLIVGDAVPSKLQAAFREAGITHVNRHDPAAVTKVDAAIGELTRGMPNDVRERITDAFKFRNETEHLKDRNPTLPEMMVDADGDMFIGKFIVRADWKKHQNGM